MRGFLIATMNKPLHVRRFLGGQNLPDVDALCARFIQLSEALGEARGNLARTEQAARSAKFTVRFRQESLARFERFGGQHAERLRAAIEEAKYEHMLASEYYKCHRASYNAGVAELQRVKTQLYTTQIFESRLISADRREKRPARSTERVRALRQADNDEADGIDYKSAYEFCAVIFAAAAFLRGRYLDWVHEKYIMELEKSYAQHGY